MSRELNCMAGTWPRCDGTSKHAGSMTPCWFCHSAIFNEACRRIFSYVFISLNSAIKWPTKVFFQTNYWGKGELLNREFIFIPRFSYFFTWTQCGWKIPLFFFFFHHLNIRRTQVHPDTLTGKASYTLFLCAFSSSSYHKQTMPVLFQWHREDHYHLMSV